VAGIFVFPRPVVVAAGGGLGAHRGRSGGPDLAREWHSEGDGAP
jgi:hypothetical protein